MTRDLAIAADADCYKENAMTTPSNRKQGTAGRAIHPHARLCQAVIFRALQDLAQTQHRADAREWLLSPESDYAFATAGISPQRIRHARAIVAVEYWAQPEFWNDVRAYSLATGSTDPSSQVQPIVFSGEACEGCEGVV